MKRNAVTAARAYHRQLHGTPKPHKGGHGLETEIASTRWLGKDTRRSSSIGALGERRLHEACAGSRAARLIRALERTKGLRDGAVLVYGRLCVPLDRG